MNRKTKTKTAQLRLKLSYTALRFNPARLWGVENAVKGRDERRKKRAALDSIFNAMPPSVFFYLDTAVVVIDRMTGFEENSNYCPKSLVK